MLKKLGKKERNRIIVWTLMWLNWSVATIYIYIYNIDDSGSK